ncbi:aminotransferase class V [Methylobacterium sp. ME121]|nr:aminotransferase class V [Methylobacterium sp. ME121]
MVTGAAVLPVLDLPVLDLPVRVGGDREGADPAVAHERLTRGDAGDRHMSRLARRHRLHSHAPEPPARRPERG